MLGWFKKEITMEEMNPQEALLGEATQSAEVKSIDVKKKNEYFKKEAERCKTVKRSMIKDWQDNINYRRARPYRTSSDQDRVTVPLDWSLTKEKEAQLFSQVPAVHISHPPHSISKEAL